MNKELQQRIDKIHEICGGWGLYEPGNSSSTKQALKATSEIGELAGAVLKNDIDEIKDAIGDIFVCWVNFIKIGDGSWLESGPYIHHIEDLVLSLSGDWPCINFISQIAHYYDLTLLECIDSAIEVISKRKGKIVLGVFQKD